MGASPAVKAAGDTTSPSRRAITPRGVLMTADAVGGVWDYALELAGGLAARDVAVTLATTGPAPNRDQQAAAAAIEGLHLVSRDFRLEWMDDPWEDVDRAGEWLLDLESQVGAEIVHLNGYAHGSLPWSAPALVVGHSCVCSWWEAVKAEPAPPRFDVYRTRVRAGLRGADAVVAPTSAMLRLLERHYGPLRGVVIPNGRSGDDFPPGVKEPFVFSAGRLWDEAKNLGLLAAAAPNLPWPVYVAGDMTPPEHAARSVVVTDATHLHLVGLLSAGSLRSWLGRASIYVLPAKYEPFGLTALEAALAGCALVLGDVPSLRETWDDAAVFVPTSDDGPLVEAVRGLVLDERRRRDVAGRARERALALSSDRMLDAYLDLYASLRRTPILPETEGASCVS